MSDGITPQEQPRIRRSASGRALPPRAPVRPSMKSHDFIPNLKERDRCKVCAQPFAHIIHVLAEPKLGRKRHLTEAEESAFLAWYATARTVMQKAQEMGVSIHVLRSALRRNDVKPTLRGPLQETP